MMEQRTIRCLGCMNTFSAEFGLCPHCGYVVGSGVENGMHIMPGTLLADRYILGKVVGFGGFGITYIAWDQVLYRRVAIKEYLPSEFATRAAGETMVTVFADDKAVQFRDGMWKFVDEAKRLAKFQNDNGIVRVYDSFEENNTAYIVMEFLEGETLSAYLKREGKVPASQAIAMIMPVIRALSVIHGRGIIHRDIAPDNVFLTSDGKVKLIDFGAARYATTTKSRSLTVIVKPGYSPEEQYRSRGDQGPHTDVYAVGAILYRMITGETPPDALERRVNYEKNKKDVLKPIRSLTGDVTPNQAIAIHNALNVKIEDRTPDMKTLEYELTTGDKVARRGSTLKKIDLLTWPRWAKFGVPAAILAVTALVVLVAVGWNQRGRMHIPDGQTLIPNVISKDTRTAEKRLKDNKLGFLIANRVENDVIPKNKILTQDPDAGYITDVGTIVNVVISAGRGDVVVPNVTGMLFDDAKAQLEKLGLVVKRKEKRSSEMKDAVLSQSVDENETLEIGTEITLTVSKGSSKGAGEAVKIPDVVGKSLDEAKKLAQSLDLAIIVEEYEYSDRIPKDQIMEQLPKAGETGKTGSSIGVVVSRGAEKVVVPDLYGRERKAAEWLLKARGIRYRVEYGTNTQVDIDVVYAQSVAADTEIDKNTTVVISVCNNNPMLETAPTKAAAAKTPTQTDPAASPTKRSEGFTYANSGQKAKQSAQVTDNTAAPASDESAGKGNSGSGTPGSNSSGSGSNSPDSSSGNNSPDNSSSGSSGSVNASSGSGGSGSSGSGSSSSGSSSSGSSSSGSSSSGSSSSGSSGSGSSSSSSSGSGSSSSSSSGSDSGSDSGNSGSGSTETTHIGALYQTHVIDVLKSGNYLITIPFEDEGELLHCEIKYNNGNPVSLKLVEYGLTVSASYIDDELRDILDELTDGFIRIAPETQKLIETVGSDHEVYYYHDEETDKYCTRVYYYSQRGLRAVTEDGANLEIAFEPI